MYACALVAATALSCQQEGAVQGAPLPWWLRARCAWSTTSWLFFFFFTGEGKELGRNYSHGVIPYKPLFKTPLYQGPKGSLKIKEKKNIALTALTSSLGKQP